MAMSELAELQRRAAELAQLGRQTSDERMRDIFMYLSREFRQEAEHMVAIDGPDHSLSHLVSRYDETQFGRPVPNLDHVARSLNPLCKL
jgi:hypothetical protein